MRGVFSLSVATLLSLSGWFLAANAAEPKRPNVLMIAVDDWRPEAGCYGNALIQTPNIDRLAARGTVFNRAYCQQAVCSPSRTSLMLGRRPDTTRVYDLQTHFRRNLPDVVTLTQHFIDHGYHAQGLSKIYHGGLNDPKSWSVPHWSPKRPDYGKPETLRAVAEENKRLREEHGPATEVLERDPKTGAVLKLSPPKFRARGPAWEDPDVADDAMADGETAERAVETLKSLKDKPFFLAVGFLKPHLPFVAPKKYFDLYRRDQLSLASNPFPPKDCPAMALMDWGELRAYKDIPAKGPLGDATALDLIHGYYAATSYTDAQIGRVLDELRRQGLNDNTIVVLWGDHGWQLGEHGLWCKHTNFEIAARAPLIIAAPGQKSAGSKTDALAEFVDIYPTLCDLCSLPLPDGLEGISLRPTLDDPQARVKKAAFSQYPRGKAMGYSMRTDRYRYTEWRAATGTVLERELYDHQADPQENVNLAGQPERQELIAQLAQQLKDGWKVAQKR
jgi:arylsulfatase A-like enzyme